MTEEENEDNGAIAEVEVLCALWSSPSKTKSNYAREHANVIAKLASEGLLTTEIIPLTGSYGDVWKVTVEGLEFLYAASEAVLEMQEPLTQDEMEERINALDPKKVN